MTTTHNDESAVSWAPPCNAASVLRGALGARSQLCDKPRKQIAPPRGISYAGELYAREWHAYVSIWNNRFSCTSTRSEIHIRLAYRSKRLDNVQIIYAYLDAPSTSLCPLPSILRQRNRTPACCCCRSLRVVGSRHGTLMCTAQPYAARYGIGCWSIDDGALSLAGDALVRWFWEWIRRGRAGEIWEWMDE